jgi:6-phosphogluconolactonase
MDPQLRVFPDLATLSAELAGALVEVGRRSVAERGRFYLVLNGGGTPETLFRLLRGSYAGEPFWRQTHVFWGDERCVPPEQPGSNYRQAWEAFLFQLDLQPGKVHRIRGELAPQAAAQEYSRLLAQFGEAGCAWPRFDLVLLGMGSDGHTASLFPGANYASVDAAAVAVTADYEGRPAQRVTLTPAVFNAARSIFFMVAGESKRSAFQRIMDGPPDPVVLPAGWIDPDQGQVTWWLDKAAAGALRGSPTGDE